MSSKRYSSDERKNAAKLAGFNPFRFPAEMLKGRNLITDSGTSRISQDQRKASRKTLNAYGGDPSTRALVDTLGDIFGISVSIDTESDRDFILYLCPQGRSAENLFFSELSKCNQKNHNYKNQLIGCSSLFDTTNANAKRNNFSVVECVDSQVVEQIFGGNVCMERLLHTLAVSDPMPFVIVTIPDNSGGGLPVSLENLRSVRALCDFFDKPLIFDLCRFAKNAWAIKCYEHGYADRTVLSIVREIVKLCDGFTISFKKDTLSPMGGALCLKRNSPLTKKYPSLIKALRETQRITIGNESQGGITGENRFMIAQGLRESVDETMLAKHSKQVAYLGNLMLTNGLPVREPFGLHAVYLDMNRFAEDMNPRLRTFAGAAVIASLLELGVGACDLGYAFGEFKNGKYYPPPPKKNSIRFALPVGICKNKDLEYIADCVKKIYDNRHSLLEMIPISGHDDPLKHMETTWERAPE